MKKSTRENGRIKKKQWKEEQEDKKPGQYLEKEVKEEEDVGSRGNVFVLVQSLNQIAL